MQGLRGDQAKLARLSQLKGRIGLQGPPRDVLSANSISEIDKIAGNLVEAVNRQAADKLNAYLKAADDELDDSHRANMSKADLDFLVKKNEIAQNLEETLKVIKQQEADLANAIADARLSHFKTAVVNLDEDVEIWDGLFIKRRVAAAYPGTFMSARFGATFKPATDDDLPTFLTEEHDQDVVELILDWMCKNAGNKPDDVVGAAITDVSQMTTNPALSHEVKFLLG